MGFCLIIQRTEGGREGGRKVIGGEVCRKADGDVSIRHFRVALCLCFKAIESKRETILRKMTLFCMKMKLHVELIFI